MHHAIVERGKGREDDDLAQALQANGTSPTTPIAIVVTLLLLASVASTAGAYIYERSSADLILPGVRIGDIDVGDLTGSEAVAAVTIWPARALDRKSVV